MVADRFMHNKGEIDWYDRLYAEFDQHLANALVEVEKSADEFGKEFAMKHHKDSIHYFVGTGNQWELLIHMLCAIGKSNTGFVRNQLHQESSSMEC